MRSFGIALFLFLALPATASALPLGGMPDPGSVREKATLQKGRAIAPAGAPKFVRDVISAANRIRRKPYIWGGGHGMSGDFWPVRKGYDCSGAVSYALWGGGLVERSRTSGEYLKWGERGRGDWITIWTNNEHVYMYVAGLRWDTAGGRGPRWHGDKRSNRGFRPRHLPGF